MPICSDKDSRAIPSPKISLGLPRPLFLYVGRVAVEKNIEAFLTLDLPGTKIVVGDGPQRAELEQRFADVRFLGVRTGADLARLYAASNVFVFPSRTDTFGIVLLEALASGLPVAAFPVTGPKDALGDSDVAILSEDLRAACVAALDIPSERCRAFALTKTWAESARQFLQNTALQQPTDQLQDGSRAMPSGEERQLGCDVGVVHRFELNETLLRPDTIR